MMIDHLKKCAVPDSALGVRKLLKCTTDRRPSHNQVIHQPVVKPVCFILLKSVTQQLPLLVIG